MKRQGTGRTRQGNATISAADWIEAALQMIAESGLSALTVESLSKRLGVTKGSFYWHFAGRSELLTAALTRWEKRATLDAASALGAVTDPRRRLELMLDATAQPPRSRSLYAALAEAGKDGIVRESLERVGAARIAYLASCFVDLGLAQAEAKARAVLAYSAYRGLLQMAHEAPATITDVDWTLYPELLRGAMIPADAG